MPSTAERVLTLTQSGYPQRQVAAMVNLTPEQVDGILRAVAFQYEPDWLPEAHGPRDLVGDGQYIYFVQQELEEWIGRVKYDGTGYEPEWLNTESPHNGGLALTGTHIYWMGNHRIGRAKIDGTEVVPELVDVAEGGEELSTDGEHLYWSNWKLHSLGRAALPDATEVEDEWASVGEEPYGSAVSANYVYWGNTRHIGRVAKDGGAVTQHLIQLTEAVLSFAVILPYIYIITPHGLSRASLDGSQVTEGWFYSDTEFERGIVKLDAHHLAFPLPSDNIARLGF